MKFYRYVLDSTYKIIRESLHISHDFDHVEALPDFLPADAQLQSRPAIAHAAVHAEAE